MSKYRKLPVVVDAWPVGDLINAYYNTGLPDEIENALDAGTLAFSANSIHVTTLEGKHIAKINCMLIRGVKGEYYGCDAAIFRDTYERA
jgi:hypothetical protein